MSQTTAKVQSDHDTDYNKTNNGGTVVGAPKGATPKQAVSTKFTNNPDDEGGVNRPVRESNYVGTFPTVVVAP